MGEGLTLPVIESVVWVFIDEVTGRADISVIELKGVVLPSDVEGGGGV